MGTWGGVLQVEGGLAAAAVDDILGKYVLLSGGQCGAWVSTCLMVRVCGGVVGERRVLALFGAGLW